MASTVYETEISCGFTSYSVCYSTICFLSFRERCVRFSTRQPGFTKYSKQHRDKFQPDECSKHRPSDSSRRSPHTLPQSSSVIQGGTTATSLGNPSIFLRILRISRSIPYLSVVKRSIVQLRCKKSVFLNRNIDNLLYWTRFSDKTGFGWATCI